MRTVFRVVNWSISLKSPVITDDQVKISLYSQAAIMSNKTVESHIISAISRFSSGTQSLAWRDQHSPLSMLSLSLSNQSWGS
jgi:hypothetical protein